jgi:hypothetical protein
MGHRRTYCAHGVDDSEPDSTVLVRKVAVAEGMTLVAVAAQRVFRLDVEPAADLA